MLRRWLLIGMATGPSVRFYRFCPLIGCQSTAELVRRGWVPLIGIVNLNVDDFVCESRLPSSCYAYCRSTWLSLRAVCCRLVEIRG